MTNTVKSPSEALQNTFDVAEHLIARELKDDFVMVEFGHDALPVAYRQPFEFAGNRLYVGVEAWLRDGCNKKQGVLDQRSEWEKAHSAAQHIVFITQNTGAEVRRDPENPRDSWLVGAYEAETVLPSEVADEIVLGNILGDPHVGGTGNDLKILTECSRLLRPDGVIIIRETKSPQYTKRSMEPNTLAQLGLGLLGTIQFETPEWDALEEAYQADQAVQVNRFIEPFRGEPVYYILGKMAEADPIQ